MRGGGVGGGEGGVGGGERVQSDRVIQNRETKV